MILLHSVQLVCCLKKIYVIKAPRAVRTWQQAAEPCGHFMLLAIDSCMAAGVERLCGKCHPHRQHAAVAASALEAEHIFAWVRLKNSSEDYCSLGAKTT